MATEPHPKIPDWVFVYSQWHNVTSILCYASSMRYCIRLAKRYLCCLYCHQQWYAGTTSAPAVLNWRYWL